MMEMPFNFPIQLAHLKDEQGNPESAPAMLTVLESRASQSRRGGHKITLGFMHGDTPLPLIQAKLEMN